jgi:AraC-like DNA-binding protein
MGNVRAAEIADDVALPLQSRPARGSYSVATERTAGPLYDMHYTLELGVLLKGKARRYYPSWQVDVGPGQVWLCGVWERHGRVLLETPCERLAVFIVPTAFAALGPDTEVGVNWMLPFSVPPDKRPQAHGEMRDELLALGRRAAERLSDENDPLHGAWSLLTAMEIVLTLWKGWRPPPTKTPALTSDYQAMNIVVEMVFTSRSMVTVQEAAEACGMNRNAFSSWFTWLTGISFPQFSLRHRISRAAQQLRRTSDPVKAVAREWGFANASHLHRCFVRHYGCTPTEHRKAQSSSGR